MMAAKMVLSIVKKLKKFETGASGLFAIMS
jgi:hypothetical protein